jgi:ADP-ribosylation factor-binding protein GGA
MFDFASHQAPAPVPATAPAADDDEWAFASALPEGLPASNTLAVSDTALSISLHATREPQTPTIITMSLAFSSKSDQPISELTFMAAVTKVRPLTIFKAPRLISLQGYSLKLQPQTGRRLSPHEKGGVKQVIHLHGVEQGKGDSVKLRWKASYKVGVQQVHEQGEIPSLGIA